MRNIKLIIEYDGSNYSGWQRQDNALTVQEVVEKALFRLTGNKIDTIGSSRTDAGVHARGQVANFLTDSTIPPEKFASAINSKLPRDVSIISSEEVDIDFHSRYSSKGKKYSYTIINRSAPPAYMKNFYAYYPYKLNFENMKKAAECLIGTHDFAAFKSEGGSVKTSVRTIWNIDLRKDKDMILLEIEGDGFLYNMVRIIVGTLVEIGRGRKSPEMMPIILESKTRKMSGQTAPASGLCLEKIYY